MSKINFKKIKNEVNFYKDAVPKFVEAVGKKIIGDVPENEIQQFRKEQCENCVLFTGSSCNKSKLASHSGKTIDIELAEQSGVVTKDSNKNIRTVTIRNETYYRGCGCSLTGSTAKWKFSFSEEDLAKKDGTAPCPMGKWSKENYGNWKQKNLNN